MTMTTQTKTRPIVPDRIVRTTCPYCGVGCTLDLHVKQRLHLQRHISVRLSRQSRQPVRQGTLRV